MINPQILGDKIKLLREEAGLNQEELAKKIGIGRVAISQVEQGHRGIEFLELAKIAEVFNLKTDYFLLDEVLPDIKQNKRDYLYEFDSGKLKNVLLYILERCAGKPNIGETVLYKMLYFIDFDFFEMNRKPLTGLKYIHLQFGPVPVASQYTPVIESMIENKELKIISQDYFGMKIKRYINLVSSQIGLLESVETRTIDDVINSMSNWSAVKIEEYVHGDAPWYLTSNQELIPYNLAFERQLPYSKNGDGLRQFKSLGARDILKEIGPISRKDYDYYENL